MKKDSLGPREILWNAFTKRRSRNPSYSMRAFAKNIGVSPTSLSDFFNKKRTLSNANLKKALGALGFSLAQAQKIFLAAKAEAGGIGDDSYTLIEETDFRAIAGWQHFAILCLADLKENKADPVWISTRLNIPEAEATECISRLVRLKLLTIGNGKMAGTNINLRTPTDIRSAALRKLQHDNLQLAKKALEETPMHLRDMTSISMPIALSRMAEAKQSISVFQRSFSKKFENLGENEVYTLAVQLFPLTKLKNQN